LRRRPEGAVNLRDTLGQPFHYELALAFGAGVVHPIGGFPHVGVARDYRLRFDLNERFTREATILEVQTGREFIKRAPL